MNGKTAKKIRQMATRAQRDTIGKTIDEFFNHTIKPKPKWLPKRAWLWCLSLFIRL
jgi:hypothetical protein